MPLNHEKDPERLDNQWESNEIKQKKATRSKPKGNRVGQKMVIVRSNGDNHWDTTGTPPGGNQTKWWYIIGIQNPSKKSKTNSQRVK
ncbi:unnamed protein product [Rhizophagus irregularis]|nr:unnamed protein product [Rhizophagus irregularis]